MIPRFGRSFLLVACVTTASDMPEFEWGNWPLILARLFFYWLAWLFAYGALGTSNSDLGRSRLPNTEKGGNNEL